MTDPLTWLQRVLAGDANAFASDSAPTQQDLLAVAAKAGGLVVTAAAVSSVLQSYEDGSSKPVDVQQWASFVRRGYLGGETGPVSMLNIDFEPSHEDAIVEAVGRMDELGDLIDGEIGPREVRDLLEQLAAPESS